MIDDAQIRLAVSHLKRARRVGAVTGAGISVASGVPTFRGEEGMWRQWRPEELATPEAFARNPERVWEWYEWRRERIAQCKPNRAHEVLARWSRDFEAFTLVTQNVDGLHESAGTRHVVRYHGSIWTLRCAHNCGVEFEDRQVPLESPVPQCDECGALLRPGVVWFGEPIPTEAVDGANRATVADVFLSIGTSSQVYPAAGLVATARTRGAFTIEINPQRTPTAVDLALQGRAEEILNVIESELTAAEP